MPCVLCHSPEGHTKQCATQITGHDWKPIGVAWEELARLTVALWLEGESGSPEAAELIKRVQGAVSSYDPAYAYELISEHVRVQT